MNVGGDNGEKIELSSSSSEVANNDAVQQFTSPELEYTFRQ